MRLISRGVFIIGLAGLFFSGMAIFLNHQGFALKIVKLVFWIMSLGAMLYILESKE